ncbi:MAG: L-rhamnose mutarotase [Acidimicrobiales bacterium]
MNRIAFTLQVRPDMLDDYRRHHESVWPEMLDALRRTGWHRYSLYLRDDGLLIGYFETPGTFEQALAGMEGEEVNERWQALMAPYFEGDGAAADTHMVQLEEVFHLD